MANQPNTNLRAALIQGCVDSVGLPTKFENMPFDKPEGQSPWAAAYVLPSAVFVATLGHEGENDHNGLLQIDLNYPLLTGEADVMSKADELENFFQAGKRLVHAGVELTVQSCYRGSGREVDGWYRVSVTVTWDARVPRN